MHEKLKIREEPANTSFTFGDGRPFKSARKMMLPCSIGDAEGYIQADVVPCNIPLLLSRVAMKKGKMTINSEDDTATLMGKSISLPTTVSGHYCLPLSL